MGKLYQAVGMSARILPQNICQCAKALGWESTNLCYRSLGIAEIVSSAVALLAGGSPTADET
ncbi:MAG: hypothetical protein ACOYYU_08875 [Chloroflexota bacterium]